MYRNLLILSIACCLSASTFAAKDNSSNSGSNSSSSGSSNNGGSGKGNGKGNNNGGGTGGDFNPNGISRSKRAFGFFFDSPISVSGSNGLITIDFEELYTSVTIKVLRNGNIESSVYVGTIESGKQYVTFTDDPESTYTVIVEDCGTNVWQENL